MKIKSTEIVDTFAEAFKMYGSRIIITAETKEWAMAAAQSVTGFATSVIGCKCEAGIETEILPEESPDLRPGVSVLLFAMDSDNLGKRLMERIGQCVMTCPSTACYNGIDEGNEIVVGGQLRYFGDGYQISKEIAGKRLWRIPVMDGEFLVDDIFKTKEAVGGGNILILAKDQNTALKAAKSAVNTMREVPNVILPFPNGVVRSGSKVGSKYKALIASTNDAYCPTLSSVVEKTEVDTNINSVLEIVIDGLTLKDVEEAMRVGIKAAIKPGIKKISAGNYGGGLGQYQIQLHKLIENGEN
ncbi:MAG: formylmethanofuran--tetrahydromethanopterin N-formyltransferase [Gammaproteobacteria bacterium]|nr:formylmethanofuran--tetrahydromethanopterin N-formyltransferase [Gammaproteobacteria bacterium]